MTSAATPDPSIGTLDGFMKAMGTPPVEDLTLFEKDNNVEVEEDRLVVIGTQLFRNFILDVLVGTFEVDGTPTRDALGLALQTRTMILMGEEIRRAEQAEGGE